jgi:magnesium transporter
MGAILGLFTGIFGILLSSSTLIGIVVGLSLFFSISFATVLACVTPLVFKVLGKDPAIGSGPFATAAQDFVSIIIYLSIAVWVL